MTTLLAVVAISHGCVGMNDRFVYDDHDVIEHNPLLEPPWDWMRAFVADVWAGDEAHAGGSSYYRPLFSMALMAIRAFFGPTPAAFHATSFVLHLLATLLVYLLGRSLRFSLGARLVGAAAFGLHPLTVQAVAWASAISDPMVAVLGFGALLGIQQHLRRGSSPSLAASSIAFAASLLTLERAIAFALPMLLLPLVDAGTRLRDDARARANLLRVGGVVAIPIASVLMLRLSILGAPAGRSFAMMDVLRTLPSVLFRYGVNLVAPMNLALAYPERLLHAGEATPWVGAFLVALVALVLARSMARPKTPRWFAWVSALAVFAPALALGSLPGYALVQDRYVYAALGFLGLALGDLVFPVLPYERRFHRVAPAILLGGHMVFWPALVPSVRMAYADDLSLYASAVSSAPENALFLMNLSNELRRSGVPDRECALLLRAEATIEIDASLGDAPLLYFNLGNCERDRGRPNEALVAYANSIRASNGAFVGPITNSTLILVERGDPDGALRIASEGVRANPRSAVMHRLLAFVHARRGELELARAEARTSVQLDPNDAESRALLQSLGR